MSAYPEIMRGLRTLLLSAAVAGVACAHAGEVERREANWQRAVARQGVEPAEAEYPFATSPAMAEWTADVLGGHLAEGALMQLHAIQAALFAPEFGFSYDADLTLTAAEAFERRRGNCLSFTSLFIAMARSAGIDTFLMSVRREPGVDRADDLVVINRHVVAGYRGGASEVTVFDFFITTSSPYIQRRVIDDLEATAMFHTNLGGAAIRDGDLDRAVRQLSIATKLAPAWAPGWINLGVARYRQGDIDAAFDAYRRALEAEPQNASALTNMAFIYRDLGRDREAENALRAAAHQTTNPFTLIAMADVEVLAERYGAAARYLRKARRWYPDQPEVHDALARLAAARGDSGAMEKHRRRAAELRARAPQPAAD